MKKVVGGLIFFLNLGGDDRVTGGGASSHPEFSILVSTCGWGRGEFFLKGRVPSPLKLTDLQ